MSIELLPLSLIISLFFLSVTFTPIHALTDSLSLSHSLSIYLSLCFSLSLSFSLFLTLSIFLSVSHSLFPSLTLSLTLSLTSSLSFSLSLRSPARTSPTHMDISTISRDSNNNSNRSSYNGISPHLSHSEQKDGRSSSQGKGRKARTPPPTFNIYGTNNIFFLV